MSTAKALTAGLFGAIATIAIASLLPKPMALELLSIVLGVSHSFTLVSY